MRVFVTGATGVIGRRLVPRLLESGHVVTAAVRSPEKRAALARTGVNAVDVDLFALPHQLQAALVEHDTLINLATHMPASSARTFMPGAWRENDRLRRDAAAHLVDAALRAGVSRFIQESFAPVYPDRGNEWIDENTPIEPVHYNRSVADAERSAQRFTARGGAGVVLRFALFYGSDSTFLLEQIQLVRHGIAPLFGSADGFISSVAHDDAASAVLTALSVPSGAYNVGDDDPVTHREFADALARAIGVGAPRLPPPWLTPIAGPIGKVVSRSQRISNMKLRNSGWAPRYRSVREGFQAVANELETTSPQQHHAETARAGRSRS